MPPARNSTNVRCFISSTWPGSNRAGYSSPVFTVPAAWRVGLPDLASRLKAVPYAELGPPDDQLLRGVLVKLFADRQLVVEEPAISFLLLRMPRSLEAARELVAVIDRRALEQKSAITRSFLGKILAENLLSHGPETED